MDEVNENRPIRSTDEAIGDFAAQDWLIVLEALATCAGTPLDGSGAISQPRARRAWELIDVIIHELDLSPEEIPDQIDESWRGQL